jgi:hypothetical protein
VLSFNDRVMVHAQETWCGATTDAYLKSTTAQTDASPAMATITTMLSYNGTTMLVQEESTARILDRTVYECQQYSVMNTIADEWVPRAFLLENEWSGSTSSLLAALSGDGTRVMAAYSSPKDDDDSQSRQKVALLEYSHSTNSWIMLGSSSTASLGDLITALALSADGTVTAIRSGSGTVSVHAYKSETALSRLGGNDDSILSVTLQADVDAVRTTTNNGLALSEDGTILAVGDSSRDQVNVYQYYNATWTRLGQTITGGLQFGHAVALSLNGTVLAIGAATGTTRGTLVIGQVSVFAWDSGVWVRRGPNLNGKAVGQNFGSTVSLSGDGTVLVVSSSGNGMQPGSVDTFVWDDATAAWRWDQFLDYLQGFNEEIWGATVSANGLVIAMDTVTRVTVSRLRYCGDSRNGSNLPLCSDYVSTSSGSRVNSPTMAPRREDNPTSNSTSPRRESDSSNPMLGVWLAMFAVGVLAIAAIGWKCRFHASKRWERRAGEPKSETAPPCAAESIRVNVDAIHNHEEAFSERIPLEPLAPMSMIRIRDDDAISVNRHNDSIPLDGMTARSARALEPPGHQLFSEECPYKNQFGDDDHAPAAGLVVCIPCPYKDQFGDSNHALGAVLLNIRDRHDSL